MLVYKFINHLKTVYTHRKWVRHYCFKAGLYWQGLTHDLSKYNPIEFFESVKYYQGTRSPIDACKEANGYSKAWLHHRSHNKHHREFWTDYYDNGCYSLIIPYKYAVEMLCDFLGAGKAYMGNNFSYEAEYKWWISQLKQNICIHPAIARFITKALTRLKGGCSLETLMKNLPYYYDSSIEWFNIEFNLNHPNSYYNCNSFSYIGLLIREE